ncbi:Uncharacterised protein [Exiguobacterium aurantiacum]|uniref:Uncharacterized protein n=1 Tax=Exiguobacterium aurantiacum TaxID=33987 RepID=A0A377FST8_9BACL|nr:Uncharacterised protein [Exiguobacterium aurantiacum]
MYEGGFFLISSLIVVTWILGAALFWYTDIERTTERLSLDVLAIRFEAHLLVAKKHCRTVPLTLTRPTGNVTCRPLGAGTTEVEIRLETGERHKEVIYFDE